MRLARQCPPLVIVVEIGIINPNTSWPALPNLVCLRTDMTFTVLPDAPFQGTESIATYVFRRAWIKAGSQEPIGKVAAPHSVQRIAV